MSYAFWEEITFTALNADLSHKASLCLPVRGNRISLSCRKFFSVTSVSITRNPLTSSTFSFKQITKPCRTLRVCISSDRPRWDQVTHQLSSLPKAASQTPGRHPTTLGSISRTEKPRPGGDRGWTSGGEGRGGGGAAPRFCPLVLTKARPGLSPKTSPASRSAPGTAGLGGGNKRKTPRVCSGKKGGWKGGRDKAECFGNRGHQGRLASNPRLGQAPGGSDRLRRDPPRPGCSCRGAAAPTDVGAPRREPPAPRPASPWSTKRPRNKSTNASRHWEPRRETRGGAVREGHRSSGVLAKPQPRREGSDLPWSPELAEVGATPHGGVARREASLRGRTTSPSLASSHRSI